MGAMERFAGVDAAAVSGVQPSNSGAGGAPLGVGCERKAAIVFKPNRTGKFDTCQKSAWFEGCIGPFAHPASF